jgi:predicted nucleic acid-binding protein
MALKYLIDTSVLHSLRNEEVVTKVRALTLNGEIARCSITDLEYLYSARNEDEWEGASHLLSRFVNIEIQPEHFTRALQVQRILAQKSQCGRKIPDFIIAAVAEQLDLTLLHYDINFDHITEITGQRAEWVIPAGHIS